MAGLFNNVSRGGSATRNLFYPVESRPVVGRDIRGQTMGDRFATFGLQLPKIVPGVNTLGNTGSATVNVEEPKKSLWSRLKEPNPLLAYALGKGAQAMAGQWQNAPFAQVGALGAELAQKQAYSNTLKIALRGGDITTAKGYELLSGQDQLNISGEKTRLVDVNIKQKQEYLKLFKDVETMNVDIATKQLLYDNLKKEGGLIDAQIDLTKAEAGGVLTKEDKLNMEKRGYDAAEMLQKLINAGALERLNLQKSIDIDKLKIQTTGDFLKMEAAVQATELTKSEMRDSFAVLDPNDPLSVTKFEVDYDAKWKEHYATILGKLLFPTTVVADLKPEGGDPGNDERFRGLGAGSKSIDASRKFNINQPLKLNPFAPPIPKPEVLY